MLTIFFSYGQENPDPRKMSKARAEIILIKALKDSTLHNVIGSEPILTTEKKVIEFAEFVLFDTYGKKNIEIQKPYNCIQIDNYWVISGTLHQEIGGTFLIIIDSRNCKIIRLTHGR
ncbi:hypothetical protein IMCC3317_44020 [Kordia antarctica]|uniref:NTF2 fold domain-containing protein n=2 Tax=Kordia antarctica TaxID=1218801 RepID=A0A7L4ZQY6_9FLAO|nr:hypothetical protein IMCC3317_44020 [Kordia antarctica]